MWKPVGTHSEKQGGKIRLYASQKFYNFGGKWRNVSDIVVTESKGVFSLSIPDSNSGVTFGASKKNDGAWSKTFNDGGRFGHEVNAKFVDDDIDYDVVCHGGFKFVPGVGWLLGDTGVGIHMADWYEHHPGRVTLADNSASLNTRGLTGKINLDPTLTASYNRSARCIATVLSDATPTGGGSGGGAFNGFEEVRAGNAFYTPEYTYRRPTLQFPAPTLEANTSYSGTLTLTTKDALDNVREPGWAVYEIGTINTSASNDAEYKANYNLVSPIASPSLVYLNSGPVAIATAIPMPVTITTDASKQVNFGMRGNDDRLEQQAVGGSNNIRFQAAGEAGEPVLELTEGGGGIVTNFETRVL